MNPTSRAFLQTLVTTDSSLTPGERDLVQKLIAGQIEAPSRNSSQEGCVLITQKRAAELLSVSRVTIWRMSKEGLLHPVEILPGTLRYRLNEITRLVQAGTSSESPSRGSRGLGAVASAA